MELCGTSLFLGTSRGRLLQYQVEEETQGHRLSFSTQVVKGVKLGGSVGVMMMTSLIFEFDSFFSPMHPSPLSDQPQP